MTKNLSDWINERGVVGVRDLADFLDVPEAVIRDWAWQNDVPRVGNAYVFRIDEVGACKGALEAGELGPGEDDEDLEEDEEEEEDEDDDDELEDFEELDDEDDLDEDEDEDDED